MSDEEETQNFFLTVKEKKLFFDPAAAAAAPASGTSTRGPFRGPVWGGGVDVVGPLYQKSMNVSDRAKYLCTYLSLNMTSVEN